MHVDDPGVSYWHSAEFTWNGQYVVWDDESLGGGTCQAGNDGRIRIYRVIYLPSVTALGQLSPAR